jgi:sulfatase maturation enzyme AslB (radical SAM superfamily)
MIYPWQRLMMTATFKKLPDTSLPIFYKNDTDAVLFYSPGYLLRVAKNKLGFEFQNSDEWHILEYFAQKASISPASWKNEFKPISLHVYFSYPCNLACTYCFSKNKNGNNLLCEPSMQSVLAASKLIAANCKESGLPMTLVLHGGSEPTLSENLEIIVASVKEICAGLHVQIFSYIATNGAMSVRRAEMICGLFDLVGLSCDGPAPFQNFQRPFAGGGNSANCVEETAAIFHKNDQKFEVRVTLTKSSWKHMVSIADYLVNRLNPRAINVELVYRHNPKPLEPNNIDDFIDEYFSAKNLCEKAKIDWRTSSIRPSQIHRQYCHVFQDTFQIVPGDVASLCFLDFNKDSCSQHNTQIGSFDLNSKKWSIDHKRVSKVRKKVLESDRLCEDCFLAFHCNRSCPDVCPINNSKHLPDIRCQVNKKLMTRHLENAAQKLAAQCANSDVPLVGMEIKAC